MWRGFRIMVEVRLFARLKIGSGMGVLGGVGLVSDSGDECISPSDDTHRTVTLTPVRVISN